MGGLVPSPQDPPPCAELAAMIRGRICITSSCVTRAPAVIFGAIFQIFRGKSLKTGANPELQKIIAPRHALPRIALRWAVGGKKFMERDVGAILKFSGFSRFVAVI